MIDYRDPGHPRNKRLHTRPEQPEGDARTPAQRDRDRILYTSAFRRLAQVTQVVSPDHAQVFHNRLTHSLQTAQVGHSIADKLRESKRELVDQAGGIDPDVVEAGCLAHDIGHPPFGHCAEEELNNLAERAVGGFEGNAQSFRIVTKLAFKSLDYGGLDLTRATLAAVLKYPWFRGQNPANPRKWGAYESEAADYEFAREFGAPQGFSRTAEADLVDWADDVTYAVHDIEDFYRAGRIPMHQLGPEKDNRERKWFFSDVRRRRSGEPGFFALDDLADAFADVMALYWLIDSPYSGTGDQRSKLRRFSAQLIHRYINCVDLHEVDGRVRVKIPQSSRAEVAALKELTWSYVIEAPALATQREGQRAVIERLFTVYADAATSARGKRCSLFSPYYRDQIEKSQSDADRLRVVIDLISGMTEPQCLATYRHFTGAWPASSLEDILR